MLAEVSCAEKPQKGIRLLLHTSSWEGQKIQETGFVRAQIDYTLNPILSRIFAFAEHTFLGSRGVKINNKKMPELFWAFTNPIWIE